MLLQPKNVTFTWLSKVTFDLFFHTSEFIGLSFQAALFYALKNNLKIISIILVH